MSSEMPAGAQATTSSSSSSTHSTPTFSPQYPFAPVALTELSDEERSLLSSAASFAAKNFIPFAKHIVRCLASNSSNISNTVAAAARERIISVFDDVDGVSLAQAVRFFQTPTQSSSSSAASSAEPAPTAAAVAPTTNNTEMNGAAPDDNQQQQTAPTPTTMEVPRTIGAASTAAAAATPNVDASSLCGFCGPLGEIFVSKQLLERCVAKRRSSSSSSSNSNGCSSTDDNPIGLLALSVLLAHEATHSLLRRLVGFGITASTDIARTAEEDFDGLRVQAYRATNEVPEQVELGCVLERYIFGMRPDFLALDEKNKALLHFCVSVKISCEKLGSEAQPDPNNNSINNVTSTSCQGSRLLLHRHTESLRLEHELTHLNAARFDVPDGCATAMDLRRLMRRLSNPVLSSPPDAARPSALKQQQQQQHQIRHEHNRHAHPRNPNPPPGNENNDDDEIDSADAAASTTTAAAAAGGAAVGVAPSKRHRSVRIVG